MIYSNKYNFLFLSNPKCASTSYNDFFFNLGNLCLLRGANWANKNSHKHLNHKEYCEIMDNINLQINPFTFSTIRYPLDVFISKYNYGQRLQLKNPKHLYLKILKKS